MLAEHELGATGRRSCGPRRGQSFFNTSKPDRANLLCHVISKFVEVDLHLSNVSNIEMGYLYEELIGRFSELPNETAGEHFTQREGYRVTRDDRGLFHTWRTDGTEIRPA